MSIEDDTRCVCNLRIYQSDAVCFDGAAYAPTKRRHFRCDISYKTLAKAVQIVRDAAERPRW